MLEGGVWVGFFLRQVIPTVMKNIGVVPPTYPLKEGCTVYVCGFWVGTLLVK